MKLEPGKTYICRNGMIAKVKYNSIKMGFEHSLRPFGGLILDRGSAFFTESGLYNPTNGESEFDIVNELVSKPEQLIKLLNMKSTEEFKTTINNHLQKLGENDSLFAETLKKPDKNIDDCIKYILNTVQKSGCSGFADEEIFNMAIHYYDEDKIEAGKEISCNVVVNHKVELSDADIEKAKQKAIDALILEQKQKLTDKASKKKAEVTEAQSSLF